MRLIATTITVFIANVNVMADEYSGTIVQRQPRYSRPVAQLFKWQTLILIIGKQPHTVISKFTYSDRCKLFGKSLQRKPRHHQEGACSSAKVFCITDRSQPNVLRLYQMTVRYAICSCRKIPPIQTEIHLRRNLVLHEHSRWLLTDRQIANLCGVSHKNFNTELQSKISCSIYSPGFNMNW